MADKITRANNLLRQAVDLLNPNPNPPSTGVPVGDSRASHDSGEPSSSVRTEAGSSSSSSFGLCTNLQPR